MASYKDKTILFHDESTEFDKIHNPGDAAPHSGIYRCQGCGFEVASNQGQPLPTQNHAQHPATKGLIRWKMVVYAMHLRDK
jgi:hypothetical protein